MDDDDGPPLTEQIDALKEHREAWSLESDMKLFDALRTFSASVVERSQEVETKIDGLVSRAVETDVRLRNTFNEFLMLCKTQFIENRVYEEDETVDADTGESVAARGVDGRGGPEDDDADDEPPSEEEMRARWKRAVERGTEALAQKLFFDHDDADDDDDDPADDFNEVRSSLGGS